jgi:hypothetical protein
MKNALIDPNAIVSYISSWTQTPPKSGVYAPVYTQIANSARVAEVADTPFEVAEPLFWTSCADNTVADVYYYDKSNSAFVLTPDPAPMPEPVQPQSTGTQTL